MILLYIWIKKYGCFNNVGFNLSPKHYFKFDNKTGMLHYNQNMNCIDTIYYNSGNTSINVNAVVGNNGSGKTTFLEIIFNNLVNGKEGIKSEAIFVFSATANIHEINKIKVYYNYISEDSQQSKHLYFKGDKRYCDLFNLSNENEIINELENNSSQKDMLNEIYYIYISNIFDNRYYSNKKIGSISDLSTIGLIRTEMDIYTNSIDLKYDTNLKFFYSEFSRQIRFITEYENYKLYVPFSLPEKVIVTFSDFENKKDEISKQIDDDIVVERLEEIYQNSYYKENRTATGIFKDNIAKRITIMLLNDFVNEPTSNRRKKELLYPEILNEFRKNNINSHIWDYVFHLLKQIKISLKNITSSIFVQKYLDFMSWIDENINLIGDFRTIQNEGYFIIPTFTIKNKYIGIQRFFEEYQKTAHIAEYLNFSWGLSTGENTLISLFSRFYSITKKNDGKYYLNNGSKYNYKKIIVLFDEADLTFHPAWQQQFMLLLNNFIQNIYNETEIQIILTTHSPIILSDIPKSNVIFLQSNDNNIIVDDNDKHCETFAANISMLFYDSFFMKKGSIGEFSKKTINEIINAIKPNDNGESPNLLEDDVRKLRKFINIIGDDILKDKLLEMLDACQIKVENVTNEIKRIDEQIKELENKKRKLQGEKNDTY